MIKGRWDYFYMENNMSNEKSTRKENNVKNNVNGTNQSENVNDSKESCIPSIEEFENIRAQLDAKSKKSEEYFDMLQRTVAEFDNYKKRTIKEKQALYSDAVCDVVSAFLPVIDDIDRAIEVCKKEADGKAIEEGIELIKRKAFEVLKSLGVEEIECVGKDFDPNFHEAVMHVEDDEYGKNTVVEEFQKGYKSSDKVIRHSVVKVAN
jgi:molecular chaperone GrpE